MTTRDNERLHKIHGIEQAVKNTHLSSSIVTQRSKRHNDETWRPLQGREARTQRWTPHSHSLFTVSWDKTPPTHPPRHMAREENECGDIQPERRDIDFVPYWPIHRSIIHTPCRQEAPLPLLLAVVLLTSNRKTRLSRQWTGRKKRRKKHLRSVSRVVLFCEISVLLSRESEWKM